MTEEEASMRDVLEDLGLTEDEIDFQIVTLYDEGLLGNGPW